MPGLTSRWSACGWLVEKPRRGLNVPLCLSRSSISLRNDIIWARLILVNFLGVSRHVYQTINDRHFRHSFPGMQPGNCSSSSTHGHTSSRSDRYPR